MIAKVQPRLQLYQASLIVAGGGLTIIAPRSFLFVPMLAAPNQMMTMPQQLHNLYKA
jgi:hypothetical protein